MLLLYCVRAVLGDRVGRVRQARSRPLEHLADLVTVFLGLLDHLPDPGGDAGLSGIVGFVASGLEGAVEFGLRLLELVLNVPDVLLEPGQIGFDVCRTGSHFGNLVAEIMAVLSEPRLRVSDVLAGCFDLFTEGFDLVLKGRDFFLRVAELRANGRQSRADALLGLCAGVGVGSDVLEGRFLLREGEWPAENGGLGAAEARWCDRQHRGTSG